MRELRRDRCVHRDAANLAAFHAPQQILQSLQIHRLMEYIFHYFIHQWMIGNLNVA